MIRLREATMLALTKLRTRKVRLVMTIVISGLLFGGLTGLSMISNGIFNSVADFGKEGFADRYIISSSPNSYMSDDKWVAERAQAIYKDTVARKQAEAKRLGIDYSAANDRAPVSESNGQKNIDYENPAVVQAMAEYDKEHPVGTLQQLKTAAAPFKPLHYFQTMSRPYDSGGSQLKVLKDGKEALSEKVEQNKYGQAIGTDSFVNSWWLTDSSLLAPFILPKQNLKTGADGSIPVIVPLTAAEQLAKVAPLPAKASAKQKLERSQQIRSSVAGLTFDVCYRNQTSAAQIGQAQAVQQEIEANKGKKDYRQPDFVYGVPEEACAAVPIVRDVRDAEQKDVDAKQLTFDQTFGKPVPVQTKLHFRIVGVVPDQQMTQSSIEGLAGSLLSSSLGTGWYTPLDQSEQNPLIKELFFAPGNYVTNLVELPTAASARAFMEKESCQPDFSKYGPGVNPAQKCLDSGHYFSLNPYGSNSLAIETARRGFNKVFVVAALIIAGIAAIIMMGTVGKMVADSRRETAVFRAIGAKRLDIAQIYIIYTVCVSLLIASFALVLGFLLAFAADLKWSQGFTYQALLAYNTQDLSKEFHLYGWYLPHILLLICVVVAAGLVSAVIPLLRNLRRNPMRDMRDDT